MAICHKENNRAVLDVVINQRPPFDPRQAVARFAKTLKVYRCFSVVGDQFAGNTFVADFQANGISYRISELTKSALYEAFDPKLNAGEIILLDEPEVESQLLGLVWRNNIRVDHLAKVRVRDGEHCVRLALFGYNFLPSELGLVRQRFAQYQRQL